MKREDIIRMAREAGFFFHDAGYAPILHTVAGEYSEACFQRFAALVAEAEREACAKVCEELQDHAEEARASKAADEATCDESKLNRLKHWSLVKLFNVAMRKCADAIRARSTT